MIQKRFSSLFAAVITLLFCNVYAVDEGKLTVTTDPEGVEIWLGDNYIGNSPVVEKKVPVGRYVVKLIDPVQRISQIEQVMIIANTTVVIEKKLKPKFGTLKINSIPEDADVYMTMPLGKTPLVNEFINPGKYIIEVKHPDLKYHPAQTNVVITEGVATIVADTLIRDSVVIEDPFTKKDLLRLALGAGAIAGFVWAVVESGNRQTSRANHEWSKAGRSGTKMVIGIAAGSLCVIGFEIVAFF